MLFFSSSEHEHGHEAGLLEVLNLQIVIFAQPRVTGGMFCFLSPDMFADRIGVEKKQLKT